MRLFYRILLHVLFWSFILYYNTALLAFSDHDYWKHLSRLLYTLPFDMLAVYFTIYFIIPVLLVKRRYFLFTVVLLFSAVGIILVARWVNFQYVYPWVYPERYSSFTYWSFVSILNNVFAVYSVVSMAAAFKLFKLWFKSHKQRVNLEKQNLKSELALLRVQINPHFLFNTLNNIDSLVQSNPEEASRALIKLSDIMRYMLYDASIDKVPLEKELEYIESYVSLEKLRQKDSRFTQLEILGQSNGFMVAPMLLIPFIENAFKHGSKNLLSPGVVIKINNHDGHLSLFVLNYFNDSEQKDKTQGIGLQNVKRRLELLYPGKHELSISSTDKKYIVNLKIDLL